MKTEYLRRDPFPQPLLPADTGSLPSPPLSCPGAPPSSLPPFPSWPLQVLRCLHVPRHQVPTAAFSCRVLAHCQAAHCRGGEFFKPSLIRETTGGREKGKRKVVDSVKVCQNSGCTRKTSRKWKEREGKPGRPGDPPACLVTQPSPSSHLGVGVWALEKSSDTGEGLVTDLALSHSV